MSSEAITRNDLANILNEVLPPTPSEYKKLLWTNPLPTSGYSAFDLTLSEEYDACEIIFSADNGNSLFLPSVLVVAGKSPCSADYVAVSGARYSRDVSLNGTTLSFSVGYYQGSANVNAVIPQLVYGIKYERVAPPQVEFPNYSTEEQQVGTWIDGKPIYRKVIPTSLTAGLNSITAPSNIDTFVTLRGMEKESGGAQAPIPKGHNSTFAYQIGMYYAGGNIYIEVGSSLTYITSAYIICEYTKTTD